MTTIAYKHKDGIVAFDSRLVAGGIIVTDERYKAKSNGECLFVFSGDVSDFEEFVKDYPNIDPNYHYQVQGALLKNGEVYHVSNDEGIFSEMLIDFDFAWGSGAEYAYTAMDCGLGAIEAVEKAKLRDIHTGGDVNHVLVVRDKELPL